MKAAAFLVAILLVGSALGQGARLPAEVVDAFHAALSLLDRGLVVYEFGLVDPTVEAYALRHLPFDMDVAVATQWQLDARHVGGTGDERWVLSTYRVTGKQSDGTPIDQTTLETAILRRSGGAFRIVHLHWSTSDAAFQARSQGHRTQQPAR